MTEHIVPYLPGFDLDPKDIRFLGTPIDLIAFKGLNDSLEDIEIVFIEVKTGGSVLSAREREVKKAVEQKRVSWRVFNPDLEVDGQKRWKGLGADSEEKHEPVSDIDTAVVVDGLKALDPKWPIREADMPSTWLRRR